MPFVILYLYWLRAKCAYGAYRRFSVKAATTPAATVPASREYMIPDADIIYPSKAAMPTPDVPAPQQMGGHVGQFGKILPRSVATVIILILVFGCLLALRAKARQISAKSAGTDSDGSIGSANSTGRDGNCSNSASSAGSNSANGRTTTSTGTAGSTTTITTTSANSSDDSASTAISRHCLSLGRPPHANGRAGARTGG
ncbi:hypothetical protein LPJ81_003825 [Coemansia sp. IMI 209127]|nr:hypothetical protein LPJ81_003825 [Coemansia sp. IMI 209127]